MFYYQHINFTLSEYFISKLKIQNFFREINKGSYEILENEVFFSVIRLIFTAENILN